MSHTKILADLKNRKFAPVYLFDGEEPYYIDLLSDYIAENVLDEAEREFNQSILYAQDVKPEDLVPVVKRYPMMAEYQVVIVREAQNWRSMDGLESIISNPVSSTILVINIKGKKADGRSKIPKLIKEKGVYFTSSKLRDSDVPKWINDYCKAEGLIIDPRAAAMLAEHIGNHLGNLINAFDKLKILVPKGEKITPEHISQHVGISKDFNIFELQNALGSRNDYRALLIAKHFAERPKDHHVIPVLAGLYRYFLQLLKYHALVRTTDKRALASAMGINPYFLDGYQKAAANYHPFQVLGIIDILHDIDLKSKGVNATAGDSGELIKEMVSRILRA